MHEQSEALLTEIEFEINNSNQASVCEVCNEKPAEYGVPRKTEGYTAMCKQCYEEYLKTKAKFKL